jgi:AraC-like DNA-binding protein
MRDRPELTADPLSDVLAMLEVSSGDPVRVEAGGAWALHFPAYDYLKFLVQLEGSLWLQVDGDPEPQRLDPGDCMVLRDGRAYVAGSDLAAPVADGPLHFSRLPDTGNVVRWGDAPWVVMLGGRFGFDQAQRELLDTLMPANLVVRAASASAPALRAVLDLLAQETQSPQAGQRLVARSLAWLALVAALRARPASSDGWLGALADSKIGSVLKLLHAAPARRWTLQELAAEVGMSRSALVQRFRAKTGMAPLNYLLHWRMRLARYALRKDEVTVATLAYRLGYASESAFSAAFKRVTGLAPAHYRRAPPKEAA